MVFVLNNTEWSNRLKHNCMPLCPAGWQQWGQAILALLMTRIPVQAETTFPFCRSMGSKMVTLSRKSPHGSLQSLLSGFIIQLQDSRVVQDAP